MERKNNKKLKLLSLLFIVLFSFAIQTIAYSAINSTMKITGDAYARVEADVRITDFRLATTNKATSSYEEFGKSHIVTEVNLTDATSTITYYIEITNYGSADIGIFDINGLPSGVNYSIKDYNLHDKICDDTGKCNSFIKKTYEITLTTTGTYAGNVQLNFDFRTYHTVTYTDIENKGYPTEVIDGGTLKIPFQEDLKRVQVLYNNREILFYKTVANGQTVTLSNITKDLEVKIKPQVARMVKGNIDEIGGEVCIGEECFYIISNAGSTVTMLAKYNLYAYGSYENGTGVYNKYGNNATKIQHSSMVGYEDSLVVYEGVYNFSNTSYWTDTSSTYPTYVYDNNSSLYEYTKYYKEYLEGLGAIINNSRLLKYEEAVQLGCSSTNNSCSGAPNWLYSTSYWTGSANDDNTVWYIRTNKQFKTKDKDFACYFGIRPVIELDIDEIRPLVRVESGDTDTAGSEICIGDECFYVISSDTDSITMLAKYNLYVGNECTDSSSSSCTAYGDEATGKQDSNMLGYVPGQSVRKGTIAFSSTYYWSSTVSSFPAYVYDSNSTLYSYVENYKSYLEGLGTEINEGRLITKEEVETLGCSSSSYTCSNAPSWVYSTTYWSGSASDITHVWRVDSYGSFNINYYDRDSSFGVRPVITIPKWIIADTIEFTIDGTTYKAKEGMTWEEWCNSEYNTLGAYISGDLISTGPLARLHIGGSWVYKDNVIDGTINYTILTSGGSND